MVIPEPGGRWGLVLAWLAADWLALPLSLRVKQTQTLRILPGLLGRLAHPGK